MAAVVTAVNDSPIKPKEVAMEPAEDAHDIPEENKKGLNLKDEKEDIDAVDGDIPRPDVLITTEMIKEEQELAKEGEQEEDKIKQEHDKIWKELDEKDRENRYKKLQFLLSKSTMYTQYLLSRMEKQKTELEKKAERLQKRKEKEEKNKQVEEKPQEPSDNTERKVSLTADVSMEEKNVMSPASTSNGLLMSPGTKRSTRGGSRPGTPNSQDSQGSNRGKKRKAGSAANSPNITNFFKKQKVEDQDIQKGESVDQEVICQENKENDTDAAETESEREPVDNKSTIAKKDDALLENENDEIEDSGVPKLFTGGELRKYQIEGYSWLKCLYENGVNGILADEMGLGKTVQCIAMMAHLVNMGVPGPYLVVAPLSTLPNWQSEFERFAPKVPVVLYHGSIDTRNKLRRKIFKRFKIRSGIEVRPVVITSYEITIRDRKLLQNFEWRYLIVDEGHRIKNTHCRLIRELRLYKNTHRLLLTGTPLQNNLAELWSLLNFLLPEIFDDLGSFETWLDVERITEQDADERIVKEEQQKNILSMLHQILTPFMLRRLKQDVDLNIPPKKEVLVYAPLSVHQSEFYEATVDRTILQKLEDKNAVKETQELDERGRPIRKTSKKKVNYALMLATDKDYDETPKKGRFIQKDEEEIESWVQSIIDNQEADSSKNKIVTPKTAQITIRLQNIMMQLRKCCNHPYLLEYPLMADEQYRIDEDIVTSCGKMVLLDRMLKELKKKGHKVLIFSQMTKMLDILEDYCYLRKMPYCRLDGNYSMDERKEQMDTFNDDKDVFLFLLSTRAGGLGINLTAADTVIIYDSDWNPQCDLQAQDRCHRIGQTKPVVIYRFVTANTIDQKIVERAAAKRKLEKMVIHKEKFKTGIKDYTTEFKPLTPEELQALLKSKDHQMVMKGKDEWSNISDIDLGQILDRSDLMEKWMSNCEGKPAKTKANKKSSKGKSTKKDVQGLFKVIDDDEIESITEEDIKELTEKVKLS